MFFEIRWIKLIFKWKRDYSPPKDILADGHISIIKISYRKQKIETRCWCDAPVTLEEFYKALKKLLGIDITCAIVLETNFE